MDTNIITQIPMSSTKDRQEQPAGLFFNAGIEKENILCNLVPAMKELLLLYSRKWAFEKHYKVQ